MASTNVPHPQDSERRRSAHVFVKKGAPQALIRSSKERRAAQKAKRKEAHHSRKKVAIFNYSYYNVAFQFFIEHVLDAEYIAPPKSTRRTLELGSRESSDFVCAPFKHILGCYIEELEAGADVLMQVAGPCRLGYYGELQEAILRDMGYDFEMINFALLTGKPATEYVKVVLRTVNPDLSISVGVKNLVATIQMILRLDTYNDSYMAHAGFEVEPGSFERAREAYYDSMRACTGIADIERAQREGMEAMRAIPTDEPLDPVRVGLVGEYFTAVDGPSNLEVEKKLEAMHVSVAREMNMTHRNIFYNEPNLRRSISDYVDYDMGPTSTLTIAAAKKYAEEGYDGIIHLKSSGCTPEVDCMPVLQRISRDYRVPILYLSYDSQTSDAGLDTRLEAFYDMISMKKVRS